MERSFEEVWPDASVQRLHQNIQNELGALFGHDAAKCAALLEESLAEFPHWTPDFMEHQSPFETALRIQFRLALGGDPSSSEYLDWRKQFKDVWEARREPTLTEAQKSILRSRGVDV